LLHGNLIAATPFLRPNGGPVSQNGCVTCGLVPLAQASTTQFFPYSFWPQQRSPAFRL